MNGKIKTDGKKITNFDYEEFQRWCKENGKSISGTFKDLGFSVGYFWNAKTLNSLNVDLYFKLIKELGLPEGTFILPTSGRYPWGEDEFAPDKEKGVIRLVKSESKEAEKKTYSEDDDDKAADEFVKSLTEGQRTYFYKFLAREKKASKIVGMLAERGKIYQFRSPKDDRDKLVLVVSAPERSADQIISIMFVDDYETYRSKSYDSVIAFMFKGEKRCVNCNQITYSRRECLKKMVGAMSDAAMELIDAKIVEGLGL